MDYKNVALMLLCLVCLAGVSCGGFIDRFTPCEVTEQSMSYADREFPPLGIMTLYEAKQIKERIIIKHRVSQLTAKRIAEDDKYAHDDAIKYIDSNIQASESFQEVVVGSVDSPMSIMGLLGTSGLGLMAGRMLKRKNDFSPAEVKDVVSRRLAEERSKLKA
jgi:hypothetical protein